MSINQSVIVGRLTRDPELKTTGSGFPFVNFCVAVDRPYKSGEEKQCDFIDCTAWRSSAEFLAKWFRKGSPIGIVGRIQTRNFQTQDGQKRKATELVVDNISFVGGSNNSNGGNGNGATYAAYDEPGCNAPAAQYAGYPANAPTAPQAPKGAPYAVQSPGYAPQSYAPTTGFPAPQGYAQPQGYAYAGQQPQPAQPSEFVEIDAEDPECPF